jgi:hypothetical protein
LRALEYGEIPEGEFFNQPAETSNPAAGSAKPKKSAEMGARGKMLGGIKPARVSLKTRVKEQGRVKLRHASSSHAAKDVMDGRARDTGAHTDRKPARASRVKPAAAGHAASANGRESIPLPGSVVPENLDAWLEQKSQEVMAQWR